MLGIHPSGIIQRSLINDRQPRFPFPGDLGYRGADDPSSPHLTFDCRLARRPLLRNNTPAAQICLRTGPRIFSNPGSGADRDELTTRISGL